MGRIHADPAIWVAGVRALMLQALHPVAIHGVWQNSAFREDPIGRLWRTVDYLRVVTAGTSAEVAAAGARVREVHRSLRFTDPATSRIHRVDEPELLLWVHCAGVGSFLDVVRRAGLPLGAAEADRYVRQQRAAATHVGLRSGDVPGSVAELRAYLTAMRPRLRVTDQARRATAFLLWPSVDRPLALVKPLWFPVAALGYACLPRWARREYTLLPELPDPLTTALLRGARRVGLCLPRTVREGLGFRDACGDRHVVAPRECV